MNAYTLALGIAALTFGTASAYLYKDRGEMREQAVLLQSRIEQLERRPGSSAPSPASDRATLPPNPFGTATPADIPASAMTAPAPPPAALLPQSGPAIMATGRSGWERSRKMLENPEYRDAMKRQQKIMLPRMYPDLQTALQLDDQQTDQLLDVLAEQQIRNMTDRPPFSVAGERPDQGAMREWQARQQQMLVERQTEIDAVLGEARAQQWKTYQGSLQARAQVRELRSSLDSAGLSLPPEQTEKLVAAMSAEQQKVTADLQSSRNFLGTSRTPADRATMFERQIDVTRQQQQRIRAAAAPYLSSQQLDHLERMQASQLEMQEINLKMIRAQSEAEARGDLPPNPAVQGAFMPLP